MAADLHGELDEQAINFDWANFAKGGHATNEKQARGFFKPHSKGSH